MLQAEPKRGRWYVIRKGTPVRLRGKTTTAKVVRRMRDIKGGVVLDRELSGFRCWNVLDLEKATQRQEAGNG